nr:MAG TPA: hypothetical protein [Caudoviricetes sp.]
MIKLSCGTKYLGTYDYEDKKYMSPIYKQLNI